MAETQALVRRLLASQNSDGGWPFSKGTSWVEPTAFALLALRAERSPSPALARGQLWLLSQQRPSGGWAPNPALDVCTSVTSIATMAFLAFSGKTSVFGRKEIDNALGWTTRQIYPDDFSLSLLLAKVLNHPPPHAPGSVAWYPGTAGWVIPTALTVLTLEKAAHTMNRPELHALAAPCCSYLVNRRCADGGWNHGGSKTRSEDANSYPETTGLALLALRSASVPPPASSVSLAKRFAGNPQSIEGLSWIQMALHSETHRIPDPQPLPAPRTVRDAALRLLALRAQSGENALLGA